MWRKDRKSLGNETDFTLHIISRRRKLINVSYNEASQMFIHILSTRSLIKASWHLIKGLLSSHGGQNTLSTKPSRKYDHMVFRNSPQTTAIEKHTQAEWPWLVKNSPGRRGFCQRGAHAALGGAFRRAGRQAGRQKEDHILPTVSEDLFKPQQVWMLHQQTARSSYW